MRLSIAILASYLATITVALPTAPVADAGALDASNPSDNLVSSEYGGFIAKAKRLDTSESSDNLASSDYGGLIAKAKRDQNKRCDITDLECWQHHGGGK